MYTVEGVFFFFCSPPVRRKRSEKFLRLRVNENSPGGLGGDFHCPPSMLTSLLYRFAGTLFASNERLSLGIKPDARAGYSRSRFYRLCPLETLQNSRRHRPSDGSFSTFAFFSFRRRNRRIGKTCDPRRITKFPQLYLHGDLYPALSARLRIIELHTRIFQFVIFVRNITRTFRHKS